MLLREVFGLLGEDPRALLRAGAGPASAAGFARLAAGRRGRERLRLMLAEDPVLVLWLGERAEGREEVRAAVELEQLEHGLEEPDAEVAGAAAGPRRVG